MVENAPLSCLIFAVEGGGKIKNTAFLVIFLQRFYHRLIEMPGIKFQLFPAKWARKFRNPKG